MFAMELTHNSKEGTKCYFFNTFMSYIAMTAEEMSDSVSGGLGEEKHLQQGG